MFKFLRIVSKSEKYLNDGYPLDIHMKKIKSKLVFENVKLYYEKKVTKFGNSAKIDCPKKYIGRKAIIVIEDES